MAGDFITIPIIYNSGGNAVTNLAFSMHLNTALLQPTLGSDDGGVRKVISVTFPSLPSVYKAGALVQTGREGDLSFFVDLDPTTVRYPNTVPLIPDGVLANLTVQAFSTGSGTTPINLETAGPPIFAGLSNGSSSEVNLTVHSGSVAFLSVQTINLLPGSNIIGLTVVPTTTTPASVFGTAVSNPNLKSVFQYLCTRDPPFVFYNPTIPPFLNTMTTVDIQHGYWVDVNVTGTLKVTGTIPTYPISIPLCVGTNLVSSQ